jgi:hypothetical protein
LKRGEQFEGARLCHLVSTRRRARSLSLSHAHLRGAAHATPLSAAPVHPA